MEIKTALENMDALDDDQWTNDGAPRLDVLSEAVGEKVSRSDVTEAAPEFSRENMAIPEKVDTSEADAEALAAKEAEDAEALAKADDEAKAAAQAIADKAEEEKDGAQEEPPIDLGGIETYLEGEPLPEKKFVPFLMELDPSVLEILEKVLAMQLQEAEEAMSRAADIKNRIKLSLAYTKNRIKSEVPDMSDQQAIQAFIKSQTEARGARITKTRELLKGVDLRTLDPRMAIDRAMARKTGRGATRPARPLMGS